MNHVILALLLIVMGGDEIEDGQALKLAKSEVDYRKFASTLLQHDVSELVGFTEYESAYLAVNSSWAIASRSLLLENGQRQRRFDTGVKMFCTVIDAHIDCAPAWLRQDIQNSSEIAGSTIMFRPSANNEFNVGEFRSHGDGEGKHAADANILARTIHSNRFPTGFEPSGKQAFISFAISQDHGIGVRHIYSRRDVGSYVVASDYRGIRWAQRVFRGTIGESGEHKRSVRAEVVLEGDRVWLFAMSDRELIIESFDLVTGKPAFRFNSLIFNTTSR